MFIFLRANFAFIERNEFDVAYDGESGRAPSYEGDSFHEIYLLASQDLSTGSTFCWAQDAMSKMMDHVILDRLVNMVEDTKEKQDLVFHFPLRQRFICLAEIP